MFSHIISGLGLTRGRHRPLALQKTNIAQKQNPPRVLHISLDLLRNITSDERQRYVQYASQRGNHEPLESAPTANVQRKMRPFRALQQITQVKMLVIPNIWLRQHRQSNMRPLFLHHLDLLGCEFWPPFEVTARNYLLWVCWKAGHVYTPVIEVISTRSQVKNDLLTLIDHIPGWGSLMLKTLAELGMWRSSVRPSLFPTGFPGGQTRGGKTEFRALMAALVMLHWWL